MYRTIDTVHEYRLRYPDTAPIPTLTQSGLLGLLLAAQDRKAAKLARRKAMWKRLCDTPRKACIYVWRTLIEPPRSQPVEGLKSLPANKSKRIDVVMSEKIRTYAELQKLIRISLRAQNPEWVGPDGRSPICKIYEARFAKLIGVAEPDKNDEKGGMTGE